MAVLAGATYIFSLSVLIAALDHNGVVVDRVKNFEFNPTTVTDHIEATTAAAAMVILLDAVNDADILDWWITARRYGDVGSVASTGNPYKEAALTLNPLTPGNSKISHTIFAPDDTMISGKNVVESDAGLLAYLDVFEDGGDFLLSDGEQIQASNQIAASRTRSVSSGKNYG
jgi:hypothetical protein